MARLPHPLCRESLRPRYRNPCPHWLPSTCPGALPTPLTLLTILSTTLPCPTCPLKQPQPGNARPSFGRVREREKSDNPPTTTSHDTPRDRLFAMPAHARSPPNPSQQSATQSPACARHAHHGCRAFGSATKWRLTATRHDHLAVGLSPVAPNPPFPSNRFQLTPALRTYPSALRAMG